MLTFLTHLLGLKNSLVRRVSVLASLCIFASIVTIMGIALGQDLDRSIKAERELLLAYSGVFAAAVAPAIEADDKQAAQVAMTGISRLPRVTYARLETISGQKWVSIGTDYIIEGTSLDITQRATFDVLSSQRLYVSSDVIRGGVVRGQLVIFSDAAFLRAKLISGVGAALLFGLIGTLLTSAVCILVLRSSLRPVEKLTFAMEEAVENASFTAQVDASRDDEIGRLGQSFNKMMSGLMQRDGTIRRQVETLEEEVDARTSQYRLAKEEAELANAAKSEFLATVSHEIRTPLNGMLVMSELLASSGLADKQKRYSNVIRSSGHSLLAIINDILDVSKIEADKLELESIPVDLDELVENTLMLFAGQAAEKGLTLGAYIAPFAPQIVLGDLVRLTQILTNLINNALKFTETGGVLVNIANPSSGEGVVISVIDTGIGIAKDRQDQIFEAFLQADQSTTRKYGGTGLGLSICQKLVVAMQGEISVTSEEGVGSIFTCDMPLPVSKRYSGSASGVGGAENKSALLIDDDSAAVRSLALMLQFSGVKTYLGQRQAAGLLQPDYILGSPRALQQITEASGQRICLSSLGEYGTEALLKEGGAGDALVMPAGPARILALGARLQTGALLGVKALQDVLAAPEIDNRDYTGLSIMAADDNAVNREVLSEALRTLGVDARIYSNGRALLQAAQEHNPDIVLLDISMPDLDGYEVLAELQKMRLSSHPDIIALTAHMTPQSRQKMSRAGFDALVSKPFTLKQIMDVLRNRKAGEEQIAGFDDASADDTQCVFWDTSILLGFEAEAGKPGFALRMVNLYKDNSVTALKALAAGLNKDSASIRQAAHALKSMSTTVGAAHLAALCEDIEADPRLLTRHQVKRLALSLKTTLKAMKRYETGLAQTISNMKQAPRGAG